MAETLPYQAPDRAMFEIRRVGWRKWLGASRADAWTALASQLDAKFDEGGWVKSDSVVLTVGADGSWRVVLDMYMVTVGRVSIPFTRLRVPFLNPSGFRFSVQKADFFTPVMTQLGAQDVSVGVPAFNESVVVKSSDAVRAVEFFQDAELRRLIVAAGDAKLEVADHGGGLGWKFPPQADVLQCVVAGDERDLVKLRRLFQLCLAALDRLAEIGVAEVGDPGVSVY